MSMAGPAGTPESNQEPPQEVAAGVLPPANEQRRALVWKNIITRTFDLETAFNRVVRSHFKSLEQESLRSLEGVKGWRLRNQKAPPSDFFLFEMEQANERIIRLTQPLYRRTVQRAGDGLFAELGLATSFDLASPQAILLIARQAIRIKGINETVAKLLQQSLREGLMAGEGIDLLRDRVENVFRASQGRSRAIARTEVGSSFNGGRQVAMQEAGINRQEWLTARDGDVREAHIRVDGEVAVLGQNFSNGLAYPQDPNGPAREVVNCRCVAVPVVEGEAA